MQRQSKAKASVNHISMFHGAACHSEVEDEVVIQGSGHWPPYFVGLGLLVLCFEAF